MLNGFIYKWHAKKHLKYIILPCKNRSKSILGIFQPVPTFERIHINEMGTLRIPRILIS